MKHELNTNTGHTETYFSLVTPGPIRLYESPDWIWGLGPSMGGNSIPICSTYPPDNTDLCNMGRRTHGKVGISVVFCSFFVIYVYFVICYCVLINRRRGDPGTNLSLADIMSFREHH